MNAINIIFECDNKFRKCSYFKECKTNIELSWVKKKDCIHNKHGECTKHAALIEAFENCWLFKRGNKNDNIWNAE